MSGGWRYTTVNCARVWQWYARVGAPEPVLAAAACTRAAALAAAVAAAAPVPVPEPAAAPAPAPVASEPFANGSEASPGLSAGGLFYPASLTGAPLAFSGPAWANPASWHTAGARLELPSLAPLFVEPGYPGSPLVADVPIGGLPAADTPVPEPGSLPALGCGAVLACAARSVFARAVFARAVFARAVRP